MVLRVENEHRSALPQHVGLDTGIIQSPDFGSRILTSVDFTHEADAVDHYGHGTHIASIIAPLVFSTIVVGVAGGGALKKVGRMGAKALIHVP